MSSMHFSDQNLTKMRKLIASISQLSSNYVGTHEARNFSVYRDWPVCAGDQSTRLGQ